MIITDQIKENYDCFLSLFLPIPYFLDFLLVPGVIFYLVSVTISLSVKFDTMGQIWKECVQIWEILFSAEPECHFLFYIQM